jgi:hypothetical protein
MVKFWEATRDGYKLVKYPQWKGATCCIPSYPSIAAIRLGYSYSPMSISPFYRRLRTVKVKPRVDFDAALRTFLMANSEDRTLVRWSAKHLIYQRCYPYFVESNSDFLQWKNVAVMVSDRKLRCFADTVAGKHFSSQRATRYWLRLIHIFPRFGMMCFSVVKRVTEVWIRQIAAWTCCSGAWCFDGALCPHSTRLPYIWMKERVAIS